jgi:hypothetical protein
VFFADDGIVLSIVVRDQRDGPIQEALPPDRIMFKKLRGHILAIVDGEILAFGSPK